MSVITQRLIPAIEYAAVRVANERQGVKIYRRDCITHQQYIATGYDSDVPDNSTLIMIFDPDQSSVYDHSYQQGDCC